MESKLSRIGTQFVKYIYAGISLYILIVVATTSPSAFTLTKKPFLFSNPALLIASILLAGFLFSLGFVLVKHFRHSARNECALFDQLALRLTLLAIPLQFYLTCNYYFRTGWDVQVLDTGVDAFLSGNNYPMSLYLSFYPNNILLFFVTIICKQLDSLFGIISPSNGVLPFILLNCIISSATGWLTYQNVLHFCSRRGAMLGFALYWSLVGISPWVGIPYSDSLALAFPSLLLFLYTRNFAPILKWGLIGFIAGIAYNVKPQSFLIFIAIVLITFIHSNFTAL